MRAMHITTLKGPDAIELVEVDEPTVDAESVVIDVHVAGVTFPEVSQSRGEYHLRRTLPFIPGTEVAGVVRSAPSDSGLGAGQRVAAFPGVGGYAETVTAPPTAVFPLPDNVSFDAGAALPMNYLTMHFALLRRAQMKPGETVLVHGAAGGVGTAAVQLAAALDARVIAVVSAPGKVDTAKAAGADEVVLADAFEDAVLELTGSRGVDIVVDPVGAAGSLARCAFSRARAAFWSSAQRAATLPRPRSTALCVTTSTSQESAGARSGWSSLPICRSSGPRYCLSYGPANFSP